MSTITAILEPDADGSLHLLLPPELRGGKVKVEAKLEQAGIDAGRAKAGLWKNLPDPDAVPDSGLSLLQIEPRHLAAVRRLPMNHRDPFDRDPFDRVLIAQARVEGLTLVSCDPQFSAYDVPLRW